MASTTLVNFDIENGEKVIEAMDNAGKEPNVALWAKLPDYGDWRLVLASDRLNQSSPLTAYSEINDAISKAGIPFHRQPTILMSPMDSPMIEALRRAFASAKEVFGMRLGGQTFGDKYLEEAFVYRDSVFSEPPNARWRPAGRHRHLQHKLAKQNQSAN